MIVSHPAKFSDSILATLNTIVFEEATHRGTRLRLLDPMAGIGRIHELDNRAVYSTVGIELEPEWAAASLGTIQGDATALTFPDGSFDAVITSPPYGNRMADHHNAQERCRPCKGIGCAKCDETGHRNHKRMTYKHQLGRDLSAGSGAAMQWGADYRDWSKSVIAEMVRVVAHDGLVVINISNHIRGGVEQEVAEWWLASMLLAGLRYERAIPVETARMGFGANRDARVECEWVFVTRKP